MTERGEHTPGIVERLLPCPFCGGEASADGSVRYHENHEAWWDDGERILDAYFCNCVKCGISNLGLLGHRTRADAIAKWNKRPEAADLISELVGALEETWRVLRAAGLLNLTRGVQLGQTSWYVKACDAERLADAAITKARGGAE